MVLAVLSEHHLYCEQKKGIKLAGEGLSIEDVIPVNLGDVKSINAPPNFTRGLLIIGESSVGDDDFTEMPSPALPMRSKNKTRPVMPPSMQPPPPPPQQRIVPQRPPTKPGRGGAVKKILVSGASMIFMSALKEALNNGITVYDKITAALKTWLSFIASKDGFFTALVPSIMIAWEKFSLKTKFETAADIASALTRFLYTHIPFPSLENVSPITVPIANGVLRAVSLAWAAGNFANSKLVALTTLAYSAIISGSDALAMWVIDKLRRPDGEPEEVYDPANGPPDDPDDGYPPNNPLIKITREAPIPEEESLIDETDADFAANIQTLEENINIRDAMITDLADDLNARDFQKLNRYIERTKISDRQVSDWYSQMLWDGKAKADYKFELGKRDRALSKNSNQIKSLKKKLTKKDSAATTKLRNKLSQIEREIIDEQTKNKRMESELSDAQTTIAQSTTREKSLLSKITKLQAQIRTLNERAAQPITSREADAIDETKVELQTEVTRLQNELDASIISLNDRDNSIAELELEQTRVVNEAIAKENKHQKIERELRKKIDQVREEAAASAETAGQEAVDRYEKLLKDTNSNYENWQALYVGTLEKLGRSFNSMPRPGNAWEIQNAYNVKLFNLRRQIFKRIEEEAKQLEADRGTTWGYLFGVQGQESLNNLIELYNTAITDEVSLLPQAGLNILEQYTSDFQTEYPNEPVVINGFIRAAIDRLNVFTNNIEEAVSNIQHVVTSDATTDIVLTDGVSEIPAAESELALTEASNVVVTTDDYIPEMDNSIRGAVIATQEETGITLTPDEVLSAVEESVTSPPPPPLNLGDELPELPLLPPEPPPIRYELPTESWFDTLTGYLPGYPRPFQRPVVRQPLTQTLPPKQMEGHVIDLLFNRVLELTARERTNENLQTVESNLDDSIMENFKAFHSFQDEHRNFNELSPTQQRILSEGDTNPFYKNFLEALYRFTLNPSAEYFDVLRGWLDFRDRILSLPPAQIADLSISADSTSELLKEFSGVNPESKLEFPPDFEQNLNSIGNTEIMQIFNRIKNGDDDPLLMGRLYLLLALHTQQFTRDRNTLHFNPQLASVSETTTNFLKWMLITAGIWGLPRFQEVLRVNDYQYQDGKDLSGTGIDNQYLQRSGWGRKRRRSNRPEEIETKKRNLQKDETGSP